MLMAEDKTQIACFAPVIEDEVIAGLTITVP
jgi:hypothetical protein